MSLTPREISLFQRKIWRYYRAHGRTMPWREDTSFYSVLVSEIMLQQTQARRVEPYYRLFMERFPTLRALAAAHLHRVLITWQGLGYNRRARYLHETAKKLIAKDRLPRTSEELVALPGIGPNTAGAIMAYSFNQPVVFIETNIRSVYLREFLAGESDVDDAVIRELVAQTMDKRQSREWYYALMDYGVYCKSLAHDLRRSKHYKKQAPFHGSVRELRGNIIRYLSVQSQTLAALQRQCHDDQIETTLQALQREGMIEQRNGIFGLTGAHERS